MMSDRVVSIYGAPLCAISLLCIALGAARVANAAAPAASAKTAAASWSELAHWPDFTSGMWAEKYKFNGNPKPPLTEAAQARIDALPKGHESGGILCRPLGMPGMMMPGYPMAFFYTKGSIFIMSDMDDLLVRHIYMDGRQHEDPDPSWNGHSVGHWEQGTLVVDTVAINADAPLGGLPSGGSTHIIERIRLTGPDALEWHLTITNSDLLAQPWELTKTYVRHRDWEIQEASCVEGNRDGTDASGTPRVDLTPPK
jgi:hypothetical protein